MDNLPFLPKYLGDLNGNALLSSRDSPDTISLCMIFDVSVWFLKVSQLPAICFSSRSYLQEQHIYLNHSAWKHISPATVLMPLFPILLLQPQVLCNMSRAELIYPDRLALCSSHERAPQWKQGTTLIVLKWEMWNSLWLILLLWHQIQLLQTALEQMTKVLAWAVSAPSGQLPMEI